MGDSSMDWINDTYEVQVDDVCSSLNFMMATWNNKLYTIGGFTSWKSGNNETTVSDSQLRILDFTKSVDISKDTVTSVIRLPNDVPRLKWANVFVTDGKLRMFGGEHEYYGIMDGDAHFMTNPELRPDLTNKMWTFDLTTEKWEQSTSGMRSVTAVRTALAFDQKNQIGWFYGGIVEQVEFVNGTVLQGGNTPKEVVKDLYRLDSERPGPERVTTPDEIGIVDQGEMVFIGGAGEAGVLVVIGGNGGAQVTKMRPMDSVDIFDIATRTWFKQPTTADRGVYPDRRQEMCTVVASAEDNSSHNIYMYGGWDTSSDSEHSDVFILSIPAFHWVSVGTGQEFSRNNHRCARVQEKYMIAYRGRLNAGQICDKDNVYQGMSIFDMSRLEWTSKVEVDTNQKYSVPEKLYNIIGGSGTGQANFTTPLSGYSDRRLATIFRPVEVEVKNNSTENAPQGTGTSTNIGSETTDSAEVHTTTKSGPPTGAIVGGVVGGLAALIILIALFLFVRKRRRDRSRTAQATQPVEIMSEDHHDPKELAAPSMYPQEMEGYGTLDLPPSRDLYSTEPQQPVYKRPRTEEYYGTYYTPPDPRGGSDIGHRG